MTLAGFIELLASLPPRPLCFNPYASGDGVADGIRRTNLRLYLEELVAHRPDTMLVGEAPGYNGCHWSGIPFTSERQLERGVARHGLFGPGKGYRWTSDRPGGYSEPSGTILWGIIGELPRVPLVWNAFPLHPFKTGNPLSNRTPTDLELEQHAFVLKALADLFPVTRTVAIGRKAEAVLAGLGIRAAGVRHPANGGKNACREGLLALLGRA